MTEPTREDVERLTAAAAVTEQATRRVALATRIAFRPVWWLLWAIVALSVLQLYGTWNIIDGRSTSRATQQTIPDCTNPEGDCAKKNQARTAALVADLLARFSEASTAIGACTYEPTREDFQSCADAASARISAEAVNAATRSTN